MSIDDDVMDEETNPSHSVEAHDSDDVCSKGLGLSKRSEFLISKLGRLPKCKFEQSVDNRTISINAMNPRKGLSDSPKGPVWCFIDSGCNRHIVKRPVYFIKETQDNRSCFVYAYEL